MNDFEIKKIDKKIVKDSNNKDKWKVEFKKEGEKITVGEDGKGTKTVKATVWELDENGKEKKDDKGTDEDIEITYEKGNFVHFGKISKVKDTETDKKTEVDFKGAGSYRLTFWALITVLILAVLGLIWWWWSSSRSEDKEEESL